MHQDEAIHDLLDLLPIDGPPAQEGRVAAFLRAELMELGVPDEHIVHDNAQQQSEYGGEVGQPDCAAFPDTVAGPRLMFSTHMDTVPNRSRLPPSSGAGATDALSTTLPAERWAGTTGWAALRSSHLARDSWQADGDHPPVTLVFFVQEEVGLVGARGWTCPCSASRCPACASIWTAALLDEIRDRSDWAPNASLFDITGIAAHAGARTRPTASPPL